MSSTPKPGEAVKYPPPVVPAGTSTTEKNETRPHAPLPISNRALRDLARFKKK